MKKTIWTGVLTGIAGLTTAAAISAQTPAAPQSNAASADRRITVTGCLKEAPSSAAATAAPPAPATAGTTGATGTTGTAAPAATGTTGESAAAPKYLLTNASAAPAAPAGAASTTETAAAGAASAAQTFQLIANAAALTPHVGKKMELTGTLEDQNAAAGSSESAAGSETKTAVLRVESGKIVAASCSQ